MLNQLMFKLTCTKMYMCEHKIVAYIFVYVWYYTWFENDVLQ